MASSAIWLEVLSLAKALFEATTKGLDLAATIRKYRRDAATIQEADRASKAYSTYSEVEIESLARRLQGCRDRFATQGGGRDRARCICSVLKEAAEGNGGTLPVVDDWQNMYRTLECERQ